MKLCVVGVCAFLLLFVPDHARAALPTGAPHAPLSAECWPDQALQALPAKAPLATRIKAAQSWIDRCEFQWQKYAGSQILMLAQYAKFKYSLSQPYIKKIQVPLSDGRKLRGILALKPGDKARDLVVFRCGVFCDSDSNSTLSNALMNVFEENPVHMIFLNSTSGFEYAQDNGAAHFGGFDEGYQNLEVANYITKRQGKFGVRIRKVHVFGMSLGGLSALFSSMFAEKESEFSSTNFGSFVALCPMVDTRAEFDEVLGYKGLASLVFRYRTKKMFSRLPKLLSPLEKILGGARASAAEKDEINTALELSALYYRNNWNRLGFAGAVGKPRGLDRDSLLDSSNLLSYRDRFSPNTVVLHARNDMLVPYGVNSQKLKGRQSDRLGVLSTKRGNHCAFTQAMDWGVLSQFVSGLVNETRDLPRVKRPLPASIRAALAKPLWASQMRSHYQWFVSAGAKAAKLAVWKFEGRGACHSQKPHYAPASNVRACQTVSNVTVPLSELAALGMPASAKDVSTASRMERYLNGRTRLILKNGKRAVSSAEMPQWLESQGRFDGRYGVL